MLTIVAKFIARVVAGQLVEAGESQTPSLGVGEIRLVDWIR